MEQSQEAKSQETTKESERKINPFDDPEEAKHFKTVVSAYFNYAVSYSK